MKRILFLLIVAAAAMQVSAANVDANTAKSVAMNFLKSQNAGQLMSSNPEIHLAYVQASKVDANAPAFYVFNYNDKSGYIIIAGDDRAEEVLGYGSGHFDGDNLPSNVAWWLSQYTQQIEYLQENPDLVVKKPSEMFNSSLNAAASVSPLMTTKWDQSYPYYNQCPYYGNSRCVTGCVATAMAQVMNYWEYPATLPALSAYTTRTYNISVGALSGTTVDWANMADSYKTSTTSSQKAAVATLMRYCGQAVKMDYSPYGSGAYTTDQLAALKSFGYNSGAAIRYRDYYSATNWNNLMQNELTNGRPILYGGSDPNDDAGHAFVVDGWNNNTSKYYVNFGWSGQYDGYYALDAFNDGSSTYSDGQDMIVNLYPTQLIPELNVSKTALTMSCGTGETVTATFTVTGKYLEQNVKITLTDETGAFSVTPTTISTTDATSGKLVTVTFAPSAVGEHTATITCTSGDLSKTVTLTGTGKASLTATPSTVNIEAYVGQSATATFEIKGDGLASGYISGTLVDANGCFAVTPKQFTVAVANSGKTITVTYSPTAVGTHNATISWKSTKNECDPITVTLVGTATEPPAPEFQLGDVNHDGAVNISDVTDLIDYLLGSGTIYEDTADIDGTGSIDITDVTLLIDILLGVE